MPLYLNVLAWVVIGLAAVNVATELLPIRVRPVTARHARAASRDWRMVRLSCGLILLASTNWTHGVASWLALAVGTGLIVVWDLASWLRTRYRLTRAG
jgi:hypothetical protein